MDVAEYTKYVNSPNNPSKDSSDIGLISQGQKETLYSGGIVQGSGSKICGRISGECAGAEIPECGNKICLAVVLPGHEFDTDAGNKGISALSSA